MNKTSKSFLFMAALLVVASALIVNSLQNAQAAQGGVAVATYAGGTLRLTVPYHGLRAGAGQLAVEVLDPDDAVLGRSERRVDAATGTGSWREEISLTKAPPVDELVWHRVRYRFTYADAKGRGDASAPNRFRRSCALRWCMSWDSRAYLMGGAAAIRLIVTDSKNEGIAGQGSVRIDLMSPGDRPRMLFAGRLNRRGTTEAQFRFPAGLAGSYHAALCGGHADRLHRVDPAGAVGREGIDSVDHGEAHLSAGADDPRARAGAGSRRIMRRLPGAS